MNFVERQQAKFEARQNKLRNITPNPPAPIGKGTTFEVPSSSGSPAAPSPPVAVQGRKRHAEVLQEQGGKEAAAKKSRAEDSAKERPSAPVPPDSQMRTRQSENNRGKDKGPAESSGRLLRDSTPSWLRKGFRLPSSQSELVHLATEVGKSAPPLFGLHLSDPRVGRFIGDGAVERSIDPDTLKSVASVGVNDSLGLFGASIAQAVAYTKHLANLAASAGTSRQRAIDLEKKLAEKDTEILALKDSVKLAQDKVLRSEEEEKVTTTKLASAEARNTVLERRLQDEVQDKMKLKEFAEKSLAEVNELTTKVGHYQSAEYTEEVIILFRKSEDYYGELYDQASNFYERGATHILGQVHHLIPDKRWMWRMLENSYASKEFRGGADFVPFSKDELKEISDMDAQSGEGWVPPPVVHPNFFNLCDQFRNEIDAAAGPPETGREEASETASCAPIAEVSTDQANEVPPRQEEVATTEVRPP